MSDLDKDYTVDEVAEALGMSDRWVRARINDPENPAEHNRYGHKIRFTREQVDKLRASHVKAPAPVVQSITTSRKRSRS